MGRQTCWIVCAFYSITKHIVRIPGIDEYAQPLGMHVISDTILTFTRYTIIVSCFIKEDSCNTHDMPIIHAILDLGQAQIHRRDTYGNVTVHGRTGWRRVKVRYDSHSIAMITVPNIL